MQFDLDNLVPGLYLPADPELGSPAGTITAVEHRPCEDHNDKDGNGRGWDRMCGRCEVAWHAEYTNGETRVVVLDNRTLWTETDRRERAEWETRVRGEQERGQDGGSFDPWTSGL